ncbi:MAG: membrane protein insertase YidC [Proteobacteria bacterium]|nr:membrane protein insertase YidC [Pseudomonadota bacterium]MBU1740274.1 membrane protein insertase YidC [Pseudomonadota bacterium]
MQMDKRTIIALVLSGLILIVFMMVTERQKPPQKPPQTKPGQTVTAPATGQPVGPQAPVAEQDLFWPVVLAGDASDEKNVTVVHPLYTAQFTNRGARLQSFVLRGTAAAKDPKKAYYVSVARKDPIPIQMVNLGLNTIVPDDKQLALALAKDPRLASLLLLRLLDVLYDRYLPLTMDLKALPDGADLTRAPFTVDRDRVDATKTKQRLVFTWEVAGRYRVQRIYTFDPKNYGIHCLVKVTNLDANKGFQYQPFVYLYNRPDLDHSGNFRGVQFLIEGRSTDDVDVANIQPGVTKYDLSNKSVRWVAYSDPYFITVLAVPKPLPTNVTFRRAGLDVIVTRYQGASQKVDSAGGVLPSQAQEFIVYLGPKSAATLDAVGEALGLGLAVDFGWFDFIAKPLLWLMNLFYSVIPNYGVAIILLTILLKILFWPLTHKSYASMKRMGDLQPKIKELRAQYGDDKQKLNQEMMALWKAHKVNPMGGCWPMLMQIPVFFALFQFLRSAIELRHAPFILWMNDLSVPDRLPLGFDIPYVDKGLPVLTILMAASMWLQMKITPSAGDPKQQKMMAMIMPAVFLFIFLGMPSGLVLYWLVYNILSIGQQWRIHNMKVRPKKKAA